MAETKSLDILVSKLSVGLTDICNIIVWKQKQTNKVCKSHWWEYMVKQKILIQFCVPEI